ncbi:MAG: PKD domain-containing protein [Candidatus Poseidoniales archaeon]
MGEVPWLMKQYLLVVLLLTSSLAGCFGGDDNQSGDLEAIFSFSPLDNIREGQTISFDGSASTPSSGSITYKWDFQTDGSVDATGKTTTWVYATAGDYIVTLSVSNGIETTSQNRTVTVFTASAAPPVADAGSFSSNDDCEGDSPPDGNYYLFYICEMDRDATASSDRKITATTTADLDASGSTPAEGDYIKKWEWDMNLKVDSDGDGDMKNDADESGETIAWAELAPGEYKIQLTVTAGEGMSDTDAVTVYVSYVGKWSDFLMAPNTTQQQDPEDLDFEFSVIYDTDSGNTIRKVEVELIYPQQDGDCIGGDIVCRNQLDIYGFNSANLDSKEEDSKNSSETAREDRQYEGCPSDSDCVLLPFTGYTFSENEDEDGEWKASIRNEEIRDIEVDSLIIKLVYK